MADAANHSLRMIYKRFLRALVIGLVFLSAAGIVGMMGLTTYDVVSRTLFKSPVRGANDLVSVFAAITLAASLPYTTSLKGHVAIEFLFLKLSRRGRRIGNVLVHSVIAVLFALFAWQSIIYGNAMFLKNQSMVTLRWPLFWVPYIIALCCAATVLVVLEHIAYPDEELIKP
ncbi:MAG: TRAP transporter small permease [Planctomycetaceae bacterium]|nr:TRAP transporter small permease [Planctomycetaceae bacterium]